MLRFLVVVPLLLAACTPSGAPSSAPRPNSLPPIAEQSGSGYYIRLNDESGAIVAEFDASVERVWSVLADAYGRSEIELGTIHTPTRTMGNRALAVTRRLGKTPIAQYLDCGTGGTGVSNVTSYKVQLSVLSTLAATPSGGARMETVVSAIGTPMEGAISNLVQCRSTGRLEQRLAEAVRTSLAG